MALPNQIGAYDDCARAFEAAEASSHGARVRKDDLAQATHFRLRLHHFRSLMRKESCRIYPEDAPQYNKSEFDKYVCRLVQASENDGSWWIYIQPSASLNLEIEPIEPPEGETRTSSPSEPPIFHVPSDQEPLS